MTQVMRCACASFRTSLKLRPGDSASFLLYDPSSLLKFDRESLQLGQKDLTREVDSTSRAIAVYTHPRRTSTRATSRGMMGVVGEAFLIVRIGLRCGSSQVDFVADFA